MNKYEFKTEFKKKIIGKKEVRISKISNMVGGTNGSTWGSKWAQHQGDIETNE